MFNWEPHASRAAISVASTRLGKRDESTGAYRFPSPPPEG
jgi:hypothetical protein